MARAGGWVVVRGGWAGRWLGVVVLGLGVWGLIGGGVVWPMVGGEVVVGGAGRAGRLSFRHDAPFLIVIQRNDGKNWVNIQAATCQFKQTGVATPVSWTWGAGDASIHQNPKFVTLRFRARRASSAMTLVSGTLLVTVTDSVNGAVSTEGTTINVDEVWIDPCPPAAKVVPEVEEAVEGSSGG